jgi:hypothetical protein
MELYRWMAAFLICEVVTVRVRDSLRTRVSADANCCKLPAHAGVGDTVHRCFLPATSSLFFWFCPVSRHNSTNGWNFAE